MKSFSHSKPIWKATHRGKKVEIELSFIHYFTLQVVATARARLGQGLEPGTLPRSPMWAKAAHALGPSSAAFLVASAGNWVRSRIIGTGTNSQTWAANVRSSTCPLFHNADPKLQDC